MVVSSVAVFLKETKQKNALVRDVWRVQVRGECYVRACDYGVLPWRATSTLLFVLFLLISPSRFWRVHESSQSLSRKFPLSLVSLRNRGDTIQFLSRSLRQCDGTPGVRRRVGVAIRPPHAREGERGGNLKWFSRNRKRVSRRSTELCTAHHR